MYAYILVYIYIVHLYFTYIILIEYIYINGLQSIFEYVLFSSLFSVVVQASEFRSLISASVSGRGSVSKSQLKAIEKPQ